MKPTDRLLIFANREEWRTWLEAHHTAETEAWLVHYKKGTVRTGLVYEEAVEEALCFGWIDGLMRSLDAESYALRYSPRRRRSVWSESNKRRAERLIAAGRMAPAGLAAIAAARANGEWDAASEREEALRRQEAALAAFQCWPPSRKQQVLYWIASARKAETRAKRIQAVVELALPEHSRREDR